MFKIAVSVSGISMHLVLKLLFKFQLFFAFISVTFAGIIHEHAGEHSAAPHEAAETEHHHQVQHKHAESHQSVKFIHFHPVPVYIKHEDQKYVHHPVEIGSNKHKVKLIHPETEHAKGHGLTLENHQEFKDLKIEHHGGHEGGSHHEASAGGYEVQPEFDYQAYEAAHHH